MKPLVVLVSALTVVLTTTVYSGSPQTPRCTFSVSPPMGAGQIVGPDEVTSRLQVISQPDSPVEIVGADFTGTQLLVSGNLFTSQQNSVIEVRNRSDQVIERVEVRTGVGQCQRAGGGGPFWTGRLLPGETARIRNASSGSGTVGGISRGLSGGVSTGIVGGVSGGVSGASARGVSPAIAAGGGGGEAIRVWVWVDRVDFNQCVYKPAQIIPRSLCDGAGAR